ncbi:MAG: NAAT family transporter [Aquificae bacterium]|nr:NAAT family transporter [Aquificota bacterium]
MDLTAFFLKAFLSLLAIMNPFASVPVVVSLTAEYGVKDVKKVAFKAALYAFFILLFFLFTGDLLFKFMGITLPSFKVGGGILLFLIAISLVQGEVAKEKGGHQEIEAALQRDNIALIPLAMPLLAGPGAITTVLVLRASVHRPEELLTLVLALACASAVCFAVYAGSGFIYRLLGRSGVSFISRVSGILLLAVSVQFITEGLKVLLK